MKISLPASALLLLLVSCSRDPQVDYEKTPGSVTNVQLAAAARVGIPATFNVTFFLENSCSLFDSFETWKEADTLVVKVWGLTPKDSACTKDLDHITKPFKHTYQAPGTYYLKFVQNNDRWYRDTITVTP